MADEKESLDALDAALGGTTAKLGEQTKTRKRAPSRKKKTPEIPADLQERIAGFYGAIGTGLTMIGYPNDGAVIVQHSPDIAEAWAAVCADDKAWARRWALLTTGGNWTRVIVAHGTLALAIAIQHGFDPSKLFASLFRPKQKDEAEEDAAPDRNPFQPKPEPERNGDDRQPDRDGTGIPTV